MTFRNALPSYLDEGSDSYGFICRPWNWFPVDDKWPALVLQRWTRTIDQRSPGNADFVISLPDKVLYEALVNGILTDLGITMFIRVAHAGRRASRVCRSFR